MADNQGLKPIYIEQLFRSKNPGVAKMIPGFIYSYLKKVIHQDDINDFITRYGDRKGLDFSDAILEYLHVSYQVIGEANLPSPDGRYIFVSNHPLGGPDGIILISFLGTRYPELKFPVNDLLLNLKNLNNIFLPVNKHGAQAKDAVSALEDAYASDCQMIMFPAGLVSRKQQGIIQDLEWQKSFVSKAIQHRRDIVPIFIDGRNSNFFYNLANFRKKIGLKANIELFIFLPCHILIGNTPLTKTTGIGRCNTKQITFGTIINFCSRPSSQRCLCLQEQRFCISQPHGRASIIEPIFRI